MSQDKPTQEEATRHHIKGYHSQLLIRSLYIVSHTPNIDFFNASYLMSLIWSAYDKKKIIDLLLKYREQTITPQIRANYGIPKEVF